VTPALRPAEASCAGPRQSLSGQPIPLDLTPTERLALELAVSPGSSHGQVLAAHRDLARLLAPIETTLKRFQISGSHLFIVRRAILRGIHTTDTAYGAWDVATWMGVARSAGRYRSNVLAVAHELGLVGAADVLAFGVEPTPFAWKLFGRDAVDRELQRVQAYLATVGYGSKAQKHPILSSALARLLLLAGEPRLEVITIDLVERVHQQAPPASDLRTVLFRLARVLHGMGFVPREIRYHPCQPALPQGVDPGWAEWCARWKATSTLAASTKRILYCGLVKAGRWLTLNHPEVRSPDDWTREVALEYVAAVGGFVGYELTTPHARQGHREGLPLSAGAKGHLLQALRVLFHDCQEWGWAKRHFDPDRALATPRTITSLISPRPRVIADDVWARLLWAGLHLEASDLTTVGGFGGVAPRTLVYPLALVRALAITWLFAGLRRNEIARLRVGCVRWQRHDGGPAAAQSPDEGATCLLDIPVHKTGESYTKPVDPLVGQAIGAWQAERPEQPLQVDPKTGEQVALLFCFRGQPITGLYLNRSVIPLLCRKGALPLYDARGRITTHRARATIATQLYNAKEPMTLFELQAWLGHRSPATTQHYARITPTTLSKAYADANYFARNVRAIEVLIDQDAIKSAATASGVPWRYYDLGHGLCSFEFFEQCPHRMACPRCDFYNPKESSRSQLLEAKSNLLRLLQEVPLTEEERATVDGDLAALDRLAARLAEEPTPSGQTPKELIACTKHQR